MIDKNRITPSVCGVGFIGAGKYEVRIGGVISKQYQVWSAMLARCYNNKVKEKKPTYAGCYVCDEWHDFQVFAKWHDANYFNGSELDKDILIDGNKEYSPKTCLFVTQKENKIKARAKLYVFISPDGVATEIYNLHQFCKANNLTQPCMSRVHAGKNSQHKGWTK